MADPLNCLLSAFRLLPVLPISCSSLFQCDPHLTFLLSRIIFSNWVVNILVIIQQWKNLGNNSTKIPSPTFSYPEKVDAVLLSKQDGSSELTCFMHCAKPGCIPLPNCFTWGSWLKGRACFLWHFHFYYIRYSYSHAHISNQLSNNQ